VNLDPDNLAIHPANTTLREETELRIKTILVYHQGIWSPEVVSDIMKIMDTLIDWPTGSGKRTTAAR
jgi:hypothetical protein